MIESTGAIVLLGIALGLVQLAAGIVIGRYLPNKANRATGTGTLDAAGLEAIARRLHELTHGVADDIGEHQTRVGRVDEQLRSAEAGGAEVDSGVFRAIAKVINVNKLLQARLVEAKCRFQEQAGELQGYLAESRTDPLTGLPNRRAFDEELTRRLALWERKGAAFCLAMVDIDRFKKINDLHGHPAGDHVLERVAELLQTTFREMDIVARIGGEEFAVILPSTNPRDARCSVERVRKTVADTPFPREGLTLHVTISLGVAMVDAGDDAVSLIKRADEALYAAKHGGRNQAHYHDTRECHLIVDDDNPAQPRTSPSEGTPVPSPESNDPELGQLCDGLRRRMSEISEP